MATHRKSIMNFTMKPDDGVYPDILSNQLTLSNQNGGQLVFVVADGGSDIGFRSGFKIPKNYVGTPKFVVSGILDGAMSSNTLQWGAKGITIADNEAFDAADSSEDTGSITTDHADEDAFEVSITCSNFTGFAVDDQVFAYVYLDASGNDYAGNCLITDIEFEYSDV